jgi:hypothetical protein
MATNAEQENALTTFLADRWEQVSRKIESLADVLPEEEIEHAPVNGIRTYGAEVVAGVDRVILEVAVEAHPRELITEIAACRESRLTVGNGKEGEWARLPPSIAFRAQTVPTEEIERQREKTTGEQEILNWVRVSDYRIKYRVAEFRLQSTQVPDRTKFCRMRTRANANAPE